MPIYARFLLTLSLLLILPSLAPADEEPPSDLEEVRPTPQRGQVQTTGGSIADLVAEAANPGVPEQVARARFNEILSHGRSAVPELVTLFKDGKRSDLELWVTARALGRIGGDSARSALTDGLRSKKIMARLGAVSALAVLGDPASVPALEAALYDKAMMVRAGAADALGAMRQPGSSKALGEALNIPPNFSRGKSLFVRRHIVEAMGTIGSLGSVDLLIKTLEDSDSSVQLAARGALQSISGRTFHSGSAITGDEISAWQNWWTTEGQHRGSR